MGEDTHAHAPVPPASRDEPSDDEDDERDRGLDQLAERLAEGWGGAEPTDE